MRIGNSRVLGELLADTWQRVYSHEVLINEGVDIYDKLLIHFNGSDGATTYTAETGQALTFVGTAQLDTAQKALGSASLLLDGNSDYVTIPDSADWDFGTGDFNIDCKIRLNAIDVLQCIVSQWEADNSFHEIYINGSNKLVIDFKNDGSTIGLYTSTSALSITTGVWCHLKVSRVGTTAFATLNGVNVPLTASTEFGSSNVGDIAGTLHIGALLWSDTNHYHYFNGWIDEFRISKGTARWTSAFTPPTAEYGITSLTIAGLNGNLLQNSDFETWAAGASAVPTNWTGTSGTTFSRITGYISQYALRQNKAGAATTTSQNIESERGIVYWRGRTITVGAWIYDESGISGKVMLGAGSSEGNAWVNHPGDSQWHWLSVSYTVPAAATYVQINIYSSNGAVNTSCDGMVCLEGTSVPQTNSININHYCLNGDISEEYILRTRIVNGYNGTASYGLRPNNDTGSNYGQQQLFVTSTTVGAGRDTPTSMQRVGVCIAKNELAMSEIALYAKSGYPRTAVIQEHGGISGTTITIVDLFGSVWTNTTDNIISLVVFSDQINGLGVGTVIELYAKKSKV